MHTETTATHRGTIILDQSAIMQLSKGIPRQLIRLDAEPRPQTFLDLYNFLSQNGFDIQIPQMVSHEGPGVLASGKSRYDMFSNNKRDSHIQNKWLKQVAAGEIPHISIVTNTGPKQVDDYCARIEEAISTGSKSLLSKIHQQYSDRDQFGDDAIRSMLKDLRPSPYNKPTWVLSTDMKLKDSIDDEYRKVRGCNVRNFLHILATTELLEEAGFKPGLDAEDLFQNTFLDNYIAKPLAPDFTENLAHREWRLMDACKGLKTDLNAQKEAAYQANTLPKTDDGQQGATGVARFTKRFGGLGGLSVKSRAGSEPIGRVNTAPGDMRKG